MTIRESAKPLLGVAIHPSGYYLAAAYMDKIRIYHILHDELRHFRNIEVKNCSKMKFSNGGQYFVAVHDEYILIYQSYTLERLHKFPSLSKNIHEIKFSARDECMAAVTKEGYIYRWVCVDNFRRLNDQSEYQDKGTDMKALHFTQNHYGDEQE